MAGCRWSRLRNSTHRGSTSAKGLAPPAAHRWPALPGCHHATARSSRGASCSIRTNWLSMLLLLEYTLHAKGAAPKGAPAVPAVVLGPWDGPCLAAAEDHVLPAQRSDDPGQPRRCDDAGEGGLAPEEVLGHVEEQPTVRQPATHRASSKTARCHLVPAPANKAWQACGMQRRLEHQGGGPFKSAVRADKVLPAEVPGGVLRFIPQPPGRRLHPPPRRLQLSELCAT